MPQRRFVVLLPATVSAALSAQYQDWHPKPTAEDLDFAAGRLESRRPGRIAQPRTVRRPVSPFPFARVTSVGPLSAVGVTALFRLLVRSWAFQKNFSLQRRASASHAVADETEALWRPLGRALSVWRSRSARRAIATPSPANAAHRDGRAASRQTQLFRRCARGPPAPRRGNRSTNSGGRP